MQSQLPRRRSVMQQARKTHQCAPVSACRRAAHACRARRRKAPLGSWAVGCGRWAHSRSPGGHAPAARLPVAVAEWESTAHCQPLQTACGSCWADCWGRWSHSAAGHLHQRLPSVSGASYLCQYGTVMMFQCLYEYVASCVLFCWRPHEEHITFLPSAMC